MCQCEIDTDVFTVRA